MCHHRGICQDKNLTTSTCVPSPRHLPRQKPYHKRLCAITAALAKTKTLPLAPTCHHRGICQDKNLTTSTCVPSPRHWPRQKTLPQAPACHHRGICQDKNLTTSTGVPSPRHLPRQKPYHKHRCAITAAFAKTKTLPQAPACHHPGICQDKNLTTQAPPDFKCTPGPKPLYSGPVMNMVF